MIIRELMQRNVEFVVMKYYSWLTRERIVQNEEWEVLIPKRDAKKTKGILLTGARDLSVGSKSRILTRDEVSEFKDLQRNFKCVLRNEHGAIWELNDAVNTKELLIQKHW